MIEVIYTAPCVYDSRLIGYDEAVIGYTGADPVKTAKEYLERVNPFATLYLVVKNGYVWYQR